MELFCSCGTTMKYDKRTQRMRCLACRPLSSRSVSRVGATISANAREVVKQGTLPFCRKSAGRAVAVKEEVVEREVDLHLARAGYKFLNTTVRYPYFMVTCPRCNCPHRVRNTRGTGQDKGVPDRLLYSPHWTVPELGVSLWLGIELKGSKTPFSSDEQAKLAHDGHIVVARDWTTAVEARGVWISSGNLWRVIL